MLKQLMFRDIILSLNLFLLFQFMRGELSLEVYRMYNEQVVTVATVARQIKKMSRKGLFDDRVVIINETLFKKLGFDLSGFAKADTIIFLGFDNLYIPIGFEFKGTIIFINCTINGAVNVTVEGSIFYLNSFKYGSFLNVGGVEHFDKVSLDFFIKRQSHSPNKNAPLKLLSNSKMETLIKLLVNNVPKLNFIEYAKATNLDVVYNNTDLSYTVRGKIVLTGPLQFYFPENTLLDGDCICYEYLYQEWPLSLRITGNVEVRSSYLNLT